MKRMGFESMIKLEKEISKITEGCNKELGEDYQELSCGEDFDNEESESGGSFILCQNCREKLFKAETTLIQTKEIYEMIGNINLSEHFTSTLVIQELQSKIKGVED